MKNPGFAISTAQVVLHQNVQTNSARCIANVKKTEDKKKHFSASTITKKTHVHTVHCRAALRLGLNVQTIED